MQANKFKINKTKLILILMNLLVTNVQLQLRYTFFVAIPV